MAPSCLLVLLMFLVLFHLPPWRNLIPLFKHAHLSSVMNSAVLLKCRYKGKCLPLYHTWKAAKQLRKSSILENIMWRESVVLYYSREQTAEHAAQHSHPNKNVRSKDTQTQAQGQKVHYMVTSFSLHAWNLFFCFVVFVRSLRWLEMKN